MEIEAFSKIHDYVEQVAAYSTKFGVAWIFGTVIFRTIPAIAFMDGVYDDDQEVFQCVTTQPGCNQMCFNQFSPVLPHRLYLLHITLLMLPIFAFFTWAITFEGRASREEDELRELEKQAAASGENTSLDATSLMTEQHYKRLQSRKQARKTKHRVDVMSKKNVQIHWSPRVRLYYVLHVIVRLAMEIVFFYTTYLLQTYQTKKTGMFEVWFVPDTYDCTYGMMTDTTNACSQDRQIPCWVSRPAEKSLFVLYMLAAQLLCCILGLLDIMFVFFRAQRKRFKTKNRIIHGSLMPHRASSASLIKAH